MSPERAREIIYKHAGRMGVHPDVIDAILAAAAEARREALTEAAELVWPEGKKSFGVERVLFAAAREIRRDLRDKEPT